MDHKRTAQKGKKRVFKEWALTYARSKKEEWEFNSILFHHGVPRITHTAKKIEGREEREGEGKTWGGWGLESGGLHEGEQSKRMLQNIDKDGEEPAKIHHNWQQPNTGCTQGSGKIEGRAKTNGEWTLCWSETERREEGRYKTNDKWRVGGGSMWDTAYGTDPGL